LFAAEADELIPSNPIRGKRAKKQQENNRRDKAILDLDLSDEKLALLVDDAEEYLKPIFKLAVTVGMRRDEILQAKWKDFNLGLRTICVPEENAKSKKERLIPIDPVLAAEIDLLPRLGEYISVNPETGVRRQDFRESFVSACKSVGIKTGRESGGLVFHDLRHIAAYHLVKVTDIVTASKILGHSSLDMTMRYVHPTDADKHNAVQQVAENPFRTCQNHANARGAGDTARVDASAQIH